jgi:hypothetical protein
MAAVDKCDEATLLPLIQRHIAKGTTVVSDCWKAYIKFRETWIQASIGESLERICE